VRALPSRITRWGNGKAAHAPVLAGVLLSTIPLIILFVFAGKQLVSGIMQGAVKG
jgi:ABC-type glycerol-3-phosphate transport system permease component